MSLCLSGGRAGRVGRSGGGAGRVGLGNSNSLLFILNPTRRALDLYWSLGLVLEPWTCLGALDLYWSFRFLYIYIVSNSITANKREPSNSLGEPQTCVLSTQTVYVRPMAGILNKKAYQFKHSLKEAGTTRYFT